MTAPAAVPLFVPSGAGDLFALYHPPTSPPECQGGVVYVHPFADELNQSRRIIALLARELAGRGWAVLEVDLFGCGDSAGDFRQALWATWLEDLGTAAEWLRERHPGRVSLWGLRLGGLLALDFAGRSRVPLDRIVLWQPATSGAAILEAFLRPQEGRWSPPRRAGVASPACGLEALLAGDAPVEIAGYELSPELARAIHRVRIEDLVPPPGLAIHWVEIVPEGRRLDDPGEPAIAAAWRTAGHAVVVQAAVGPPFWSRPGCRPHPGLSDALRRDFGGPEP